MLSRLVLILVTKNISLVQEQCLAMVEISLEKATSQQELNMVSESICRAFCVTPSSPTNKSTTRPATTLQPEAATALVRTTGMQALSSKQRTLSQKSLSWPSGHTVKGRTAQQNKEVRSTQGRRKVCRSGNKERH